MKSKFKKISLIEKYRKKAENKDELSEIIPLCTGTFWSEVFLVEVCCL